MKALKLFSFLRNAAPCAGILIFCLILIPVCRNLTHSAERPPLGGPCEYKKYKGEAEIISVIERTKAAQEFEIRFSFTPRDPIQEEFARPKGKTWALVQKDYSYPKKDFLMQYGIKPGKHLPCYLKVIIRGTCRPVLFEFPTIPEGLAQ